MTKTKSLSKAPEPEIEEKDYAVIETILTKKQAFIAIRQFHEGFTGLAIAEIISEEEDLQNATLDRIITEAKSVDGGTTDYTIVLNLNDQILQEVKEKSKPKSKGKGKEADPDQGDDQE